MAGPPGPAILAFQARGVVDCEAAMNRTLTAMVDRRRLLLGAGALYLSGVVITENRLSSAAPLSPMTLFSAPLELKGDWGGSPPDAAFRVVARVREVALSGVRLLSDQQPDRLWVDDHASGSPAVWLHDDPPTTAWIIVDIGARDWCKLAYQFGHELGHVLCNSWGKLANPQPPCQWVEEALVEAFSIRGLALLAASWEERPPFSGDAPFAASIRDYRARTIERYQRAPIPDGDLGRWLREYRSSLPQGVSEAEGPAILAILAEFERDPGCVEDLGAVNRWPARTGLPLEDYVRAWQASCAEIGASGHMPLRLKGIFGIP